MGEGGDIPAQAFRQHGDLGLQTFDHPVVLEDVQTRQRRGAAERIAGVGVPVEERLELVVRGQKGRKYLVGRERGGQRQIPAGEALGDAEDVRADTGVPAGEHPAGTAEPGRHFVADQQDAVPLRQLAQRLDVFDGMIPHARGALHQRLDDDRGQFGVGVADLRLGLRLRRDQGVLRGQAALKAEDVGWRQPERIGQQRLVEMVEQFRITDADRAQRIAVVGFDQRRESRPSGLAPELPILKRQLERDLGRSRPGVRIEHARQPRGRYFDQPLRQHDGRHVGEAEHGRMGDLLRLLGNRAGQRGMRMPMHVAPQRRHPVEVAPALAVDQIIAFAPDDDDRLFGEPVLHLRERMPDVTVIPRLQVRGRRRTVCG